MILNVEHRVIYMHMYMQRFLAVQETTAALNSLL